MRRGRTLVASFVTIMGMIVTTLLGIHPAQAVQLAQDRIVSDNPSNSTPNVLNGKVEAIAQIGNMVVIGGSFSSVAAPGGAAVTRNNIVAFDATTGALSTTFVPTTDGEVSSIVVSPDQQTLFIGGFFNNVNGAAARTLAKLNVSNGARTAGFTAPSLDGRIKDMRVSGGRLWIAGAFARVGGVSQPALATLNPTTGARLPYMNLPFAGARNGGATQVLKVDITPAGDKLVAIGNFLTINGLDRAFMGVLDLTGSTNAAVAGWQTNFYGPTCASVFDTYMRDLDISPDGSYVAVSTTGAHYGPTSPCDTVSRWDLGLTGSDLKPTWTTYTGGDTTYAVAITGSAVYVGGHFRWQNNPFAGDTAGPGAVGREGISALDPVNGLPLSWNPGRERGVGVFDMLATSAGLWVAHDTDRIGGETRRRIAFFPLAGGEVLPSYTTGTLPGHVFRAGSTATSGPVLYRVNAGGPTLLASDSGPDWAGDDAGDSGLRNSGSNTAGWSPSATRGAALPASAPTALFDSERWDPADASEMEWHFPVAAGTPLEVRLYFANRYSGTGSPGTRVFNVGIDDSAVLNNYDIVADVGDQVGTMKSFTITSDGSVDIRFGHVVENPLIDAVEILRTDVPPAANADDLQHDFLGATPIAVGTQSGGGVSWSAARGAVMINGSVYYGSSDGSFTARTFNGTTFGPAVAVNTSDLLVPLADWRNEIRNLTGLMFADGRLYFTLAGDPNLYYRHFTPSSQVVGAQRFTASGSVSGIDFSTVAGMMLAGGKLYFGSSSDRTLSRIDWNGSAPVPGTATTLSGPAIDGFNWQNKAMWLYTGTNLPNVGPNTPPTAAITTSCVGLACSVNGSASADPDGSIVSYAWTFGDGGTGTGVTAAHTYAAAGTYQIGLTVTDDRGAVGTVSTSMTVSQPVNPITFAGAASANVNAASASVTVPAAVAPGDSLLMFVTNNSTSATATTPAGWTLVGTRDLGAGNGMSALYARTADPTTAGSTVTVTMSAVSKVAVSLAAYHGTATTGAITSAVSAAEAATTASHITPGGTVSDAGAFVVSYWADKSSSTTAWTPPAGETLRSTSLGSGGGRITTLLTDGGVGRTVGAAAPLTATANAASARAAMWTVIVKPAA